MEAQAPVTAEQLERLKTEPELLIAIILEQARVMAGLRAEIGPLIEREKEFTERERKLTERVSELEERVRQLAGRVRELEEQNRPPAAPFGRKRDESEPKAPGKPGRRAGHKAVWKKKPVAIDEHIEARLARECPCCANRLEGVHALDQYIEEIIPAKKHVTHLRTYRGWCPKCEQTVASTHPRQVSDAGGAAGTHLGGRALGVACMLKHQMGLSFAKTGEALRELCGIAISPGGLAQAYQRVAEKLRDDYEALRQELLAGGSVHTDETSWWVGGPKASPWVFCNRQKTHCRVVESRSRATFYEVIPPEWKGVLVSDCLSVYDGATPNQQKCHAHHLKAPGKAREQGADASAGSYLDRCRNLLQTAMSLRKDWDERPPPWREERLRALKLAAEVLLSTQRIDKPQEEAVRMRLYKQIDHLFVFLETPGVEATNNCAERQLRPAVIARKVSCGQRTRKGAEAWQVLASLAATARQNATSFIDLVANRCSFAPR